MMELANLIWSIIPITGPVLGIIAFLFVLSHEKSKKR